MGIVPWEIQRALGEVFDLPLAVPDLELFGDGVAHALLSPVAALLGAHRVAPRCGGPPRLSPRGSAGGHLAREARF